MPHLFSTSTSSIRDVLDDWDNGVKVVISYPGRDQPKAAEHHVESYDTEQCKPKDKATIAPLRFLECNEKIKHCWRAKNCRQHIQRIKTIVYALHKRVLGMPYNKTDADANVARPPMSLQSAIEELTNYTNSKLDLVSTVSMLASTKIQKIQWTASDYE